MEWDVFICHAYEDKSDIVEPIAQTLHDLGVKVWYDDFTLKVGDSLSMSIYKGLANSKYGVVVLSPNFIEKVEGWTGQELGGLNAREMEEKTKVILPIWHKITKSDIMMFSPPLVDKIALKTDKLNPYQISMKLLEQIRPEIHKNLHRVIEIENIIKNGEIKLFNLKDGIKRPIIHEKLSSNYIARIILIHTILSEVREIPLLEVIDDFKRDYNPLKEIKVWEGIAASFIIAISRLKLNHEKRVETYRVLLQLSVGLDISIIELKDLNTEEFETVYDTFFSIF